MDPVENIHLQLLGLYLLLELENLTYHAASESVTLHARHLCRVVYPLDGEGVRMIVIDDFRENAVPLLNDKLMRDYDLGCSWC